MDLIRASKISKIGKAIGKATSDTKNGVQWLDKTLFTKGMEVEGSLYHKILGKHSRTLKKPIATGAIVAGVSGAVGLSSNESRNVAKMGGRIDAGEGLSNMTSSIQLSPGIQKMQEGKKVNFKNSFDNAGADGDLVFAMHRMR